MADCIVCWTLFIGDDHTRRCGPHLPRRFRGKLNLRDLTNMQEVLMPLRVGVTFNMTSILSIPFLLMACAAKPENPSFPISFSDAQKAVNEMRADPRPLARPLVIVGGFGDPN